MASKALAHELVKSGVPKPQFLQNKWPYVIKCSTSGVCTKSTTCFYMPSTVKGNFTASNK